MPRRDVVRTGLEVNVEVLRELDAPAEFVFHNKSQFRKINVPEGFVYHHEGV
jgi:hypothetical protein